MAHVRRQTDLAVQLAGHLQSRAQTQSSVLTLLLMSVGIAAGANAGLFTAVIDLGLDWAVLAALLLSVSALTLSLIAAFPWTIEFTAHAWLIRAVEERDELMTPIPAAQLPETIGRFTELMDKTEVDALDRLVSSNQWRGEVLVVSILLIGIDGLAVCWVAMRLLFEAL